MSIAALTFRMLLQNAGLPMPVQEHRFHETRRWRFDHAWLSEKVALEIEGGVWSGGRHTRGAGFKKDMEKYNTATRMGWRVVRVTPDQLNQRETIEMIQELLMGPHQSTALQSHG